jgi:hypothetical protein
MLDDRGLAWLVRRTDEEFELGVRTAAPADEASQRLVMLIDACVDILVMTQSLRVAVPPLLLTDTNTAELYLARPDLDSDDVLEYMRVSVPDPEESHHLEELLASLAELRRRAVEDLA